MIFITDILIHFVIRKHFSNQRWWLFKFSKGYPLELSPFWAKNEILNIQNLTSNNKMYQNSRLKSPKTSTCLFVKKCHNSCLELGNIKLMTLYMLIKNRKLMHLYYQCTKQAYIRPFFREVKKKPEKWERSTRYLPTIFLPIL